MPLTPTFETAKARVEAGDLSFEAMAALTIAHGENLVADSARLDRVLPWASASPIWSGPRPAEVERAGGTYGTLITTPAAGRAWMLCHAPGEKMHVLTAFSDPGDVIEHAGRRWRVVRALGPESKREAA